MTGRDVKDHLHGDAPVSPAEIERLCGDIVGPAYPVMRLIRQAVATRDIESLRLLHEGNTPLHGLLNELTPAGYPTLEPEVATRLGWPFQMDDSSAAHAIRSTAGLARSLVEEHPADEYVRASMTWHALARGFSSLDWAKPPDRFADDKGALKRQLAILSALVDDDDRLAGPATAVAVTLSHLAGQWSPKRTDADLSVLFDLGSQGLKARLTATVVSSWPRGLLPDPGRMVLFSGDHDFQMALTRAWAQAGQGLPATVVWSIEGPDGPVGHIVGESLGAAFAIVIDELRRLHRPFYRRSPVLRLSGVNAVIGRIDDWGTMQPVEGYARKLEAAGDGARVIVPSSDEQKANEAGKNVLIVPAPHWRVAAKEVRRRDFRPVTRWAAVPLAAVLFATGIALADRQQAAETARRAALSQQTMQRSDDAREQDPVLSGLLAVAAWQFDRTDQARYGMMATIATGATTVLDHHRGSVTGMAYSPDGSALAAITGGHTVRLWDATTGPMNGGTLGDHTDTAYGMAFNPRGDVLATSDNDGFIQLWNVRTRQAIGGRLRHGVDPVWRLAFARGGTDLVTTSDNGSVQVWDVATRRPIGKPDKKVPGSAARVFSPDGTTLAATSGEQGSVQLWDLATRRLIAGLPTGKVTETTFSRNGGTLAVSGGNGVSLWDVATGRPIGRKLTALADSTALALSPDESTLAAADRDGSIRLWDLATNRQLGEPFRGHTDIVGDLAFDPRGRTLASSGTDGTVRLWNLDMLRPVGDPLVLHKSLVSGVTFPSNTVLASASWDRTVRLWDKATRGPIGRPLLASATQINTMALSPDGRILATGGNDDAIRLWDVATRRPIGGPLKGHRDDVLKLAFSPDGRLLASSAADETARLWHVSTRQAVGAPLHGHIGYVNTVAFSRDGRKMATGGLDNTIRLWDLAALRPIGAPLESPGTAVLNLAFSPAGDILAGAGDEGSIRFWNTDTRQSIGSAIHAPKGYGWGLAFSPDGRTLATGNKDGTLDLWDVATHRRLVQLRGGHDKTVTSIAYSPDGGTLASGAENGSVQLWNTVLPADPVTAVCAIAGRSLTRDEWRRYIPEEPFEEICG